MHDISGMVHVYTGNGKGKTTAALGLALRAVGHGKKVYILQFMKGWETGEKKAALMLPLLTMKQFGRKKLLKMGNVEKKDGELAKKGMELAREIIKQGKCDLLILDEANVALAFGLIKKEELIELIKSKPRNMELVITGRYAKKEIVKMADIVTEMKEIKHPYKKGVAARKGIEW